MITGTCVCTNGSFTLFKEYGVSLSDYLYSDKIVVMSDE